VNWSPMNQCAAALPSTLTLGTAWAAGSCRTPCQLGLHGMRSDRCANVGLHVTSHGLRADLCTAWLMCTAVPAVRSSEPLAEQSEAAELYMGHYKHHSPVQRLLHRREV
jgi:hypothetical protein